MSDPERWLSSGEGGSEMREMLQAARETAPGAAEVASLGGKLGVPSSALLLTPIVKALGIGAMLVGAGFGLNEFVSPSAELEFDEGAPVAAPAQEKFQTASDAPPAEAPKLQARPSEDAGPVEQDSALTPVSVPKDPQPTKRSVVPTEASLLVAARKQLTREPGEALALLRKHGQVYPNGALAQERELLRVRALKALGRQKAAEKAAKKFTQEHPDSVHHVQ